ncbi:MAG: hypothetical protein JWR03_2509 [Cohnella sp.]|nr:hypothetical protein [Cohnella sp.]
MKVRNEEFILESVVNFLKWTQVFFTVAQIGKAATCKTLRLCQFYGAGSPGRYPLTEPAVKPRIKLLDPRANKIKTGSVPIVSPRIWAARSVR